MEWWLAQTFLPETATGWVGLTVGLLTGASIVLGVTIRLARGHIDARVERTENKLREDLRDIVCEEVRKAVDPIHLELRTVVGEMGRLNELERTTSRLAGRIENGLTQNQQAIASDLRELRRELQELRSHLMWDGTTERRQT